MLDLAKAADVPIDAHVLGRVGKDHLRGLAIEKLRIGLRLGRIATN
jgi:hypothetical protein